MLLKSLKLLNSPRFPTTAVMIGALIVMSSCAGYIPQNQTTLTSIDVGRGQHRLWRLARPSNRPPRDTTATAQPRTLPPVLRGALKIRASPP